VAVALAALALLLTLAGCGSGPAAAPAPPPLPPAGQLLNQASTAMASVKSTSVAVTVDPALSSMAVRSANGKLTADGQAAGTATVSQGGQAVEFQFVITQGRLWLRGPTGQYQQLPLALAAGVYDPTAVLSPDKGLPALLRTAQNGTTEAEEQVNGAPAYRVRATLNPNVTASLVPGLSGATNGLVWIDKATSRVVKAQIDVPTNGQQGGPTAPVTVTLSDFNAPVSITPPS
jgi:lipoprotein LprG